MVRTIEQTINFVREKDPQTALTKNALRKLILTKQLPACRVGTKYLVNIEVLEEYLKGNVISSQTENVDGISRIPERI